MLVKELEDGSKAVGLFNLSARPRQMAITWPDLGVSGEQRIRDLWRQRELGSSGTGFEIEVPRHGVSLITLRK